MKRNIRLIVLSLVIILSGLAIFIMPPKMDTKIGSSEQTIKIKLPEPSYESKTSVEQALLKRRSVREYRKSPLTVQELSQLLWAAQGITSQDGKRTAPSAGALYPLEVYIAVGDVTGITAGIYKFIPNSHELVVVAENDVREDLSKAALGTAAVGNGAVVIAIAGVYGRTKVKYGERGERYVHMEAGHAAQNIYLQAVSLGLGTVSTGAFYDNQVKQVMNMQKDEEPLYLMPVGRI